MSAMRALDLPTCPLVINESIFSCVGNGLEGGESKETQQLLQYLLLL